MAVSCIFATHAMAADPAVEQRVEDMLKQLTPAEKVGLLGGIRDFYTRGVDHLKLPEFKMTDGPVGTRNDGKSTAYPADILLAATFDPAIAKREGVALGRDARSRGDRIVLGPGTNIYREPQNGRNFEYMGEDPFLAGQMDTGYIQGMQSQGVSACVKHFACNNQETERMTINAVVDERTLQEIYLPAFEAAVKQGHTRAIMCSYNRLNGEYASANHYLLTDVLRKQWGFDGLCMSDWGAVHDTLGPMMAGLDLEMPGPKYMSPANIQPLIDNGTIPMAVVDEKVRHLLRIGVEMGWMESDARDASISRDDDQNDATALAVAREGIVLLKNEKSLLPLDKTKMKTVVVMGSGSDRYAAGGGSSFTRPARPVTVLAGLTAVAPDVKFISFHSASWHDEGLGKLTAESVYEPLPDGNRGLAATYFNNKDLDGSPAVTREDSSIDFDWGTRLPMDGITTHAFSGRWTGKIKPATSGKYVFVIRSDDGSRVKLDGKTIVDMWKDQSAKTSSTVVSLEAGRTYDLAVEYYNAVNGASLQFAYLPLPPVITDEEKAAIASADAAVICVRTNEGEGSDRSYALSGDQDLLIKAAVAANPKTIVVLQSGGNVAMKDWIDQVPVLVHGWFPGQAGGRAIAEILFGDTNPSGHLPITLEKEFADSPAYGNYPGDGKDVKYAEGIYVGYRWYDTRHIEPRFPFGYGLSYTRFDFKNMKVAPGKVDGTMTVSVDITNTGKTTGATVAQLYVRPPEKEPIDRPMQELKGFARADLKPGETQTVTIPLDSRSFAHWDVKSHDWQALPGQYEIVIGKSSRDIAASTKVDWK